VLPKEAGMTTSTTVTKHKNNNNKKILTDPTYIFDFRKNKEGAQSTKNRVMQQKLRCGGLFIL
jgi:hypothetical protein